MEELHALAYQKQRERDIKVYVEKVAQEKKPAPPPPTWRRSNRGDLLAGTFVAIALGGVVVMAMYLTYGHGTSHIIHALRGGGGHAKTSQVTAIPVATTHGTLPLRTPAQLITTFPASTVPAVRPSASPPPPPRPSPSHVPPPSHPARPTPTPSHTVSPDPSPTTPTPTPPVSVSPTPPQSSPTSPPPVSTPPTVAPTPSTSSLDILINAW
jgi:hypothetical protein